MNRPSSIAIVIATTLLAATAVFIAAGPLTPPAGPVNSSYKTLTEVEPRIAINSSNVGTSAASIYKITAPGSYYLTGNITGEANRNGIEIASNDVTIDLNGFALLGTVANSARGIHVPNLNTTNIVIKNGQLRGWGQGAIDAIQAAGVRLEKLTVSNNGTLGMRTGNDSVIIECVAKNTGGTGIATGSACTISNCVAEASTGANGHGYDLGDRNVITNCVALNNALTGIKVNQGCRVIDCVAGFNLNGILAYTTGTISGCDAHSNSADGIHVGTQSSVRNCKCANNGDDGIELDSSCSAVGNYCDGNGPSAQGAGVYAPNGNCHIEDNHLTFNNTGILITGSAHFVVRNSMHANNTAAIGGSTVNSSVAPLVVNPGNTFSGTSAWSNFSY